MRYFGPEAIDAALNFRELIDAVEKAFRGEIVAPLRHHHTLSMAGPSDATLLLMPAWSGAAVTGSQDGRFVGIKIVTVFPDNAKHDKPSVQGTYLLLSGEDGGVLSALDGARLTLWRTAAASALAARALARNDAKRMTMIGAGALAPFLIRAHASVRPIEHVTIWNRSRPAAEAVADALADRDYAITVSDDLAAAVGDADIVSAATLSSQPLIRGAWLKPGAHVDLVGAFRPDMRESDDDAVTRARIFLDTRAGAAREGGDIAIPLASGTIIEADIVADLFDLCREDQAGRQSESEITLFKSVGTAIEDLAAAILVHSRLG